MVTVTPNEKREIELPKPWTYIARLYSIFHEGTHIGMFWPQTQAQFRFELCTQKADFGKWEQPFAVTVYANPSFSSRSQLTKFAEKMGIDTSKPYDIEDLLGKPCQITVTHREAKNGNTYLNAKNLEATAPLGEWQTAPDLHNDKQFFWITADYTYEEKLDENWNPVLDKNGDPEQQKSWTKNVAFHWLTDNPIAELMDWQSDRVRQSREYQVFQRQQNPEKAEAEDVLDELGIEEDVF